MNFFRPALGLSDKPNRLFEVSAKHDAQPTISNFFITDVNWEGPMAAAGDAVELMRPLFISPWSKIIISGSSC